MAEWESPFFKERVGGIRFPNFPKRGGEEVPKRGRLNKKGWFEQKDQFFFTFLVFLF